SEQMDPIPLDDFKAHPENYTIVDVRMATEATEYKIFDNALSIPLDELRHRIHEIPQNLPVVVHCAGGYRSAAGSSIIAAVLKDHVKAYDLGNAIKQFEP
ncbi:rhodanese-like domain-containing protein, partial [Chitinophaga sp.]|uniref:rhodanese-like domain-containing protein n=1 Tax=Chitinophaga sp. TaxID=1869181 RepID=UPI002F95C8D5